jgi:hypothetical protein
MNNTPPEILSEFLDGAAYDPAELVEALQAPGAREALVDFVLLRAGIEQANDAPSPAFYVEMRRTLAGSENTSSWKERWVPTLALAAVIALAAFGLWIGSNGERRPSDTAEQPPTPVRTLQFTTWQGIN